MLEQPFTFLKIKLMVPHLFFVNNFFFPLEYFHMCIDILKVDTHMSNGIRVSNALNFYLFLTSFFKNQVETVYFITVFSAD